MLLYYRKLCKRALLHKYSHFQFPNHNGDVIKRKGRISKDKGVVFVEIMEIMHYIIVILFVKYMEIF